MKKENFTFTLVLAVALTMPIYFLMGFALLIRGKIPFSKRESINKIDPQAVPKKRKPRYKRPLYNENNPSYI